MDPPGLRALVKVLQGRMPSLSSRPLRIPGLVGEMLPSMSGSPQSHLCDSVLFSEPDSLTRTSDMTLNPFK